MAMLTLPPHQAESAQAGHVRPATPLRTARTPRRRVRTGRVPGAVAVRARSAGRRQAAAPRLTPRGHLVLVLVVLGLAVLASVAFGGPGRSAERPVPAEVVVQPGQPWYQ